jgi:hypothetical protein
MHQAQERPVNALDAIFLRCSVRTNTSQQLDESTIRSLSRSDSPARTSRCPKRCSRGNRRGHHRCGRADSDIDRPVLRSGAPILDEEI